MAEGNEVAIQYPVVTVEGGFSSSLGPHGQATWDSMGGQYGGGTMTNVGLFGSEISLMGSESDVNIGEGNIVIPKSDWSESDYGCYTLIVSVDDGSSITDHQSHYIYDQSESCLLYTSDAADE